MPNPSARGASPLSEAPEERRHLTIMFSDLVGSTELASSMDPEDWHDVMDAYQQRVAAVVADHGGVISQFQGDGVVAYFGYPLAEESASRDALAAGLALVGAVNLLAAELPPELGVGEMAARAGIHSGDVVVASIRAGGVDRFADVFGEVPNLAARLQGAGGPGDVIISDTTADLVSGFFELEPIGALTLKGIPREVPAYRVLRQSAARSRLETRPLISFVARSAESAWLDAQWTSVRDGPARLVQVTGEPGIGKSRLLKEFTVQLSGLGNTVSTVYCSRRDSLSPLRPFGPVMHDLPLTPDVAAAWILAQADSGPVLFVVEDAHWADPSTIEAVDLVTRSVKRVLVVLTARPEFNENPSVQSSRQLFLDKLSPEEARAIITRVPGGDGLPPTVVNALIGRADGVPLFLEELTRGAVERAGDPAVRSGIPATLSEVITARLDRLGDAKRVAQLASIVGRSFERPVLQAIAGLDRPSLDVHLQQLVDEAIVEHSSEGDGLMWFRHALIHEVAYGSVLRTDRRRAHAQVGDTLLFAGRAESQPEVVAYHLGAAGRSVEASEHWRQASRIARRNARFREAASHERELLALLPKLPEADRETIEIGARSRLTLCLTAVDQSSPEAYSEAMRVHELARRHDDREALLRSYFVLLPWWQANSDYRSIDDHLPEAEQLALEVGNKWSQETLARMAGTWRIWQGRPVEGLNQLAEAFSATGLPLDGSVTSMPPLEPVGVLVVAGARIAAALGSWLIGNITDAQRIRDDTIRLADERSVPQARAITGATSALIAQLDGDRELVAQLTSEAAKVGDEVTTRQWQQWTASLRWWAGQGIEEPEVPSPLLRPYFLMLLADDEDISTDTALGMLNEALETARATGEQFCEPEILRVRGGVLARAGLMESAESALDEAVAVARAQGSRMLELRALTDRVRLPGSGPRPRADLQECVAALSQESPTRSLQEAISVLEAQ